MSSTSDEPFEIFSADGKPLGVRPRAEVHAKGYWHRSTLLFLFSTAGELLVQQRTATKDLYANLWDHSVGEHLQPGEDYAAAAHRGAQEELGLANLSLTSLGAVRPQAHKDPAGAWWDQELQQAFRATYDPTKHGPLTLATDEVAQIEFWDRKTLNHRLAHHQHALTPWFAADLSWYNLNPS